jgi:DNA polymerase-4
MDAFYASVEEQDQPELKGKPLIVGGLGGRGVVAAASYAVRAFGVRSAMPLSEALRRCPHAICVPPRMSRYKEVSAQVFEIFDEITPLVEGLSLDEAFLDVTAVSRLHGEGETIAVEIRKRIHAKTGLTASVGIAPNKLLAKIASDLRKPDGYCRIGADNMAEILRDLPVERLYGVGKKSLPRVQAAGIYTFGDLEKAGEAMLWRAFGKHGLAMQERASGIDERPVEPNREEKSISAEETFAQDIRETQLLTARLCGLSDRAASRLRSQKLCTGSVAVKIRRADFSTYTRQCPIEPPTHDTALIRELAKRLLDAWLRENPGAAVRLLGVGVSKLDAERQGDLFETESPKGSRLDAAIDGIRGRFGAAVLTRASLLSSRDRD